jgi:hypothetical protein
MTLAYRLVFTSTARHTMRTIGLFCAITAGFILAASLPAGAVGRATLDEAALLATSTAEMRFAANPYDCYTDDGYGRYRPCSAGYKSKSKKKLKPAK